ncbi:hypothetical protein GBAR_LOCUS26256 [Geodia barretti]|uniref:Uncharacterized protein n=1 Tax=Geodia barretti TaxID=519541 RepID=A0AA35TI41_GEOBA|nr:hypothetical protein GBAR_LOCUS26256 [Geodia barretti]
MYWGHTQYMCVHKVCTYKMKNVPSYSLSPCPISEFLSLSGHLGYCDLPSDKQLAALGSMPLAAQHTAYVVLLPTG